MLVNAPHAVLLAMLASCGLSPGAQAGEPPAPIAPPADATSGEVPAAFLDRLRAMYVSEETPTPDISDGDKVRRYETILREGAWAERQHPKAPNLYQVRELMLAAAKGLATLEGTAEARERLMDLTHRLAKADAPPDTRVLADLLILRSRLDALADCPSEAADEIDLFVARYAETPAAYKALMGAADLCRIVDAGLNRQQYLRQLAQKHFSTPGVAEFLETEGASPFVGRLINARLSTLDGSPLRLPRDTMGKVTVLHFWSLGKSGLGVHDGGVMAAYKKHRKNGLEIVGINIDADRGEVSRFVRNNGLEWIQTCSGLGLKDETLQHFRVPTLPAYWLIGPDGRAIANSYYQNWAAFSNAVHYNLCLLREMVARVPYYRSGEFLLDVPQVFQTAAPGAGGVPVERLDAIRRAVFLPPSLGPTADQKAERLRHVLQQGRSVEEEYPGAAQLAVVRNWMLVAARWLSTETRDAERAKQAQEIAGRILASGTEGGPRLLADYIRAAGELAAKRTSHEEAAQRIIAFVQSYARTEICWAAEILGVVLASECGEEETRATLVRDLRDQSAEHQPKVRGFLRDVCNLSVDARSPHHYLLSLTAAAGPHRPAQPRTIQEALPRLDGRTLRLPDDVKGRIVVVHFWSLACPPETTVPLSVHPGARNDLEPGPHSDYIVVGVNLDQSRPEVEAFVKDRYKNWIHVFSGKGWDDPLARELDVYGLPRTVVLDREGRLFRWGLPGCLADAIIKADRAIPLGLPPPSGPRAVPVSAPVPAPPDRPTDGPAWTSAQLDNLKKEIALDLGRGAAMKLILIPAGQFRMGSPQNEKGRFDDEIPFRTVILTRPFYFGVYPVTRGQFAAFVQEASYETEAEKEGWAFIWNGSRWDKTAGASWKKPGFDQEDDHPVVCVSWHDAVAFCAWLIQKSGRRARLPTEARWEYACRAGTLTAYPWGDDPEEGKGWCNAEDQAARARFPHGTAFSWDDGYVFTSPVGKFKANAFGLHDMTGNVWQWCADWYDKDYLKTQGFRQDPAGPSAGTCRVTRGGSWSSAPPYCRSAARRKEPPALRLNITGFRVVVDVD
jgi:sulfatase modifying factor 1